jgi:tetratricopeptide (TPR) repeat protein
MLARLLLITVLIAIALFCWVSLVNPFDIEFQFFGRTLPTDLSTLMFSSFLLGAILAFISTLARDVKRAIEGLQESRQKKKELSQKEEFNKGMDAFLRGNLSKARTHFVTVLEKDPAKVDLYLRLSEISLKEGSEDEAFQWLERARLIDMYNIEALFGEAALYQKMNRLEDAIRTLNRVIQLNGSNLKALKNLREIYLNSRRWEDAIQTQRLILKMTKGKKAEEEETLFYLGLKYENARDFLNKEDEASLERALKEAKDIVKESKTFMPGLLLLGDTYLRMGKWAIAGKVWGKSFARFKSIVFILRLEELYLSREDPNTLLRIYQRALKRDPDNWVMTFNYARLCLRLELLDEALEAADELSLKQKDFPALHRLLAQIYLRKKDFDRAAHEFEKTFELSGNSFLPFYCHVCERESKEWVAYCPQCHHWNTYAIEEGEKIATFFPPSASQRRSLPWIGETSF